MFKLIWDKIIILTECGQSEINLGLELSPCGIFSQEQIFNFGQSKVSIVMISRRTRNPITWLVSFKTNSC